jgi:hypothetical protein
VSDPNAVLVKQLLERDGAFGSGALHVGECTLREIVWVVSHQLPDCPNWDRSVFHKRTRGSLRASPGSATLKVGPKD